MSDDSKDAHQAYFSRAYADMETGLLLGLLRRPPGLDFNQAALLAELAARGFTDAQLEADIEEGKNWIASREKNGENWWNFLMDDLDPF